LSLCQEDDRLSIPSGGSAACMNLSFSQRWVPLPDGPDTAPGESKECPVVNNFKILYPLVLDVMAPSDKPELDLVHETPEESSQALSQLSVVVIQPAW
jgi:hypothetical protein